MSRTLITAIVGCLLCSAMVSANPIADESIAEMNSLARRWPEGLGSAERTRLIDYWGRYPFEFWTPDVKRLVEERLDEYLPVLLACQEPGHAISFQLHRWFRKVASDPQQASMCAVLRRWLTDAMTKAPPDGDMWLDGPESAVRRAIMMGRVDAAEVLADYGDPAAALLIGALIESAPTDPAPGDPASVAKYGSPKWLLQQALMRLQDPAQGYILRARDGREFQLAGDLGPVVRASFGQTFSPFYLPMPIDAALSGELFATLASSRSPAKPVRSLCGSSLDVTFADGRRAQIYVGNDRPELVYEDNMRAEHPRLSLLNEALFDELERIHASQEYANWKIAHSKKGRVPN